MRDIRINKDIKKSPLLTEDVPTQAAPKKVLDFRNKKIPPYIMTFAQFIAVHVNNISLVLMNSNFEPNWFLHATAKELHLDGSIVLNANSLIVTAALNDAEVKVLRHYPPLNKKEHNIKEKPCLVELSFGVALDSVLIVKAPSVEKINLIMNHTKTIIHGGLYDFIRDAKAVKRLNETKPQIICRPNAAASGASFSNDDLYYRISPIIPKVRHCRVKIKIICC